MSTKMLIDASHPEETRVVLAKGNRLEDFDFESEHKKQIRGNIYLAKVTRVEPSLQAAFVDYGGNRHGFLAFSEIHPDYYQIPLADRQALLEEEAALVAAENDDPDEVEAADSGNGNGTEKRGRNGNKRGGRKGRGRNRRKGPSVPDAEPVAMDAILAAWEAGGGDTRVLAQAVENDSVSEALDSVFGAASRDDDEDDEDTNDDTVDSDDNDRDSDDRADDDRTESSGSDDALEEARPHKRVSRRNYKIQEVIRRRQIILVQVIKEERGNKGAALTTYMSLAGRYSVLMPNTARGGGISRKITNISDRSRLKEVVRDMDVPKGMGVILRTAGANRTADEIHRDYDYLMRLWDNVRDLTMKSTAPALVYEEGNLIKRSIRDLYSKDVSEIVVAGSEGYQQAKSFMRMLMPSHAKLVQPWRDGQPLLAKTGMESQLDKLIQPQVTLKSGGYIIINQTEALVAIDVNSGKSTREHSIEETALATNLEAAEEVARQLRLRDLAGLIVIDFIDMEENRNNRAVEKKLKECLKNDRARIQIGRISSFGLLEMSRQRMRSSVLESTMSECPACNGTGHVRSPQSIALHVLRAIEEHVQRHNRYDIVVRTTTQCALYLLNHKRDAVSQMEERYGLQIIVETDDHIGSDLYVIEKGEESEREADPDAFEPMTMDQFDTPEQLEADEAAWKAWVAANDERESAQTSSRDEDSDADDDSDEDSETGGEDRRGGRRRKRRGKRSRGGDNDGARADNASDSVSDDDTDDDGDDADSDSDADGAAENEGDERSGKRRRRRSRGRRGGRGRRNGNRNDNDGVPAAEPVGPLAELIAAQAAEAEGRSDAHAQDEPKAEQPAAPAEAKTAEAPEADVLETVADHAEPSAAQAAAANDPAPANDDLPVEDKRSTATANVVEAKPELAATGDGETVQRVRATAATVDFDAKPVVSSSGDAASGEKDGPKRGGWWARRFGRS